MSRDTVLLASGKLLWHCWCRQSWTSYIFLFLPIATFGPLSSLWHFCAPSSIKLHYLSSSQLFECTSGPDCFYQVVLRKEPKITFQKKVCNPHSKLGPLVVRIGLHTFPWWCAIDMGQGSITADTSWQSYFYTFPFSFLLQSRNCQIFSSVYPAAPCPQTRQ